MKTNFHNKNFALSRFPNEVQSNSEMVYYIIEPQLFKGWITLSGAWIRHYLGSKVYFTLNVTQDFCALPNLAVVRVCIFAYTRGNTEIFTQIETVEY